MPEIDIDGNTYPVNIVDEETHSGNEYVQIEGVNATLSDESGEAPWVERDAVFEA